MGSPLSARDTNTSWSQYWTDVQRSSKIARHKILLALKQILRHATFRSPLLSLKYVVAANLSTRSKFTPSRNQNPHVDNTPLGVVTPPSPKFISIHHHGSGQFRPQRRQSPLILAKNNPLSSSLSTQTWPRPRQGHRHPSSNDASRQRHDPGNHEK